MRPFERGSRRSSPLSEEVSSLGWGVCEVESPENKGRKINSHIYKTGVGNFMVR